MALVGIVVAAMTTFGWLLRRQANDAADERKRFSSTVLSFMAALGTFNDTLANHFKDDRETMRTFNETLRASLKEETQALIGIVHALDQTNVQVRETGSYLDKMFSRWEERWSAARWGAGRGEG